MNDIFRLKALFLAGAILGSTAMPALQAQSPTVTVSAGVSGTGGVDESLPAYGTEVRYQTTDALGLGHVFSAGVGVAYVAVAYGVPTPVGLFLSQGIVSPVGAEYEVVTDGEQETLGMTAPTYRGGIGYRAENQQLAVSISSRAEWRTWQSDEADLVAPEDSLALRQDVAAEYRRKHHTWSTNPMAPMAGWTLSGSYANVYRPGYAPWGPVGATARHDDGPQQVTTVGASSLWPVDKLAVGMIAEWSRSLNSYRRDRPRFGQADRTTGPGVSGHAPNSLPSDNASLATLFVAADLGGTVVATVRFDWFHDYDGKEDERRGLGLGMDIVANRVNRIRAVGGWAFDAAEGTKVPLSGSVIWIRTFGGIQR